MLVDKVDEFADDGLEGWVLVLLRRRMWMVHVLVLRLTTFGLRWAYFWQHANLSQPILHLESQARVEHVDKLGFHLVQDRIQAWSLDRHLLAFGWI